MLDPDNGSEKQTDEENEDELLDFMLQEDRSV